MFFTAQGKLGLYRYDGLAVVNNASGRNLDKLIKEIIAIFEAGNLSTTIETNLIETA